MQRNIAEISYITEKNNSWISSCCCFVTEKIHPWISSCWCSTYQPNSLCCRLSREKANNNCIVFGLIRRWWNTWQTRKYYTTKNGFLNVTRNIRQNIYLRNVLALIGCRRHLVSSRSGSLQNLAHPGLPVEMIMNSSWIFMNNSTTVHEFCSWTFIKIHHTVHELFMSDSWTENETIHDFFIFRNYSWTYKFMNLRTFKNMLFMNNHALSWTVCSWRFS